MVYHFLFYFFFCSFVSIHAQHVISPSEFVKEKFSEKASVFLAGSAAYPWREHFKGMMATDQVVFLDPMNPDADEICREHTLKWEIEHINKADVLLVWVPKGEEASVKTLSLTTLFEVGRFVEMKNKPLVVGVEKGHYLRDELIGQLKFLRPDVIVVDSLDALATHLRCHMHKSCSPITLNLQ